MADRSASELAVSPEDALALVCAVGARDQAQAAWRTLMSRIPFDEVNESTQRLMPAIYGNLRGSPALIEADRLRGSARYTWARNTRMLHAVLPVLVRLREAQINYRLIKGVAVQLSTVSPSLGTRVMGDIDILVSLADARLTQEFLLESGFRMNTTAVCQAHPGSLLDGAMNLNRDDTHVDLHVAEHKFPSELLRRMLSEPATLVEYRGHEFMVPTPELLVLHAAVHGTQAVSPTDFSQAARDVAVLAKSVDSDRLLRVARRTGTLGPLMTMDEALSAAGVQSSGVRPGRVLAMTTRAEDAWKGIFGGARRLVAGRRVIRERSLGRQDLRDVRRTFGTSSLRYRAWLQWGRLSVVERASMRFAGRFLDEPTSTWPLGHTAQVFRHQDPRGFTVSRAAAAAFDWRFRVKLSARPKTVRVELNSMAMNTIDAYVYCDGVPITRVVAGDTSTRMFSVSEPGKHFELSLRPTWTVCHRCYPGFDDLAVRIDYD